MSNVLHAAVLGVAGMIGLCGAARGEGVPGGESRAQPVPQADTLRVLTFNIWVGGERGDPDKAVSRARTLEALRLADADIICLQEQSGKGEEYAAGLGYRILVQGGSTAILTRHEIVGESERKWGAKIRLPSGREVWAFNVHFPAAPYQPYQLVGIEYHGGRFVSTEADAITEARLARGEPALRCLRDLQPALRSGLPVFLAGDFNEPSHLDWTPAAIVRRGLPTPVAWPTTTMFADAGFTDAYRAIYPDPVAKPGFTWTPRPDERDVMDRIDLVLFAGQGVRVTRAQVLGESPATSDLVMEAFPSDHRGMVATFTLDGPVPPPTSPTAPNAPTAPTGK